MDNQRMLRAKQMIMQVTLTTAVSLFCAGLIACRSTADWNGQRYEFKGKVVGVDPKGATVVIAHEEIPGYMAAMTMPFKLKDERLLNELAAGDRLQAILVVTDGRSRLEDVVYVREVADPSGSDKAVNARMPQPGDEVPDFSLVNQDGRHIRLHEYRGRALLLTFIYTRCPLPDYCPLMTERFAEIDRELKKEDGLYQKTHLLSISVDPDYDTPKVLRSYGAAHAGNDGQKRFGHWEFASGTRDEVKKVADYFGMQYWPEGDQIIHSLRTAIIAPDGKLFKLYNGNEWEPAEVLDLIKSL